MMRLPSSPPCLLQRQAQQQQMVIQHILANVGATCREELIALLQSPPEEQAKKVRQGM